MKPTESVYCRLCGEKLGVDVVPTEAAKLGIDRCKDCDHGGEEP